MSLATGSKILWSDISAILTNVNTARSHAGLSSYTLSGGQGVSAKADQITNLYNALYACNGITLPA